MLISGTMVIEIYTGTINDFDDIGRQNILYEIDHFQHIVNNLLLNTVNHSNFFFSLIYLYNINYFKISIT